MEGCLGGDEDAAFEEPTTRSVPVRGAGRRPRGIGRARVRIAARHVTTNAEKLRRVNWATKTLVAGWTFDLTPFDVRDSRAVELIKDQFYVLDGYDGRPSGDPLRHAVFVFAVLP
jgi:hypothetical protein